MLDAITLKNETHLNNKCRERFSSYRAVNTFPVGYKSLSANSKRAANGVLLREYCEIHTHCLGRMKRFANGQVRIVPVWLIALNICETLVSKP
jgi:hypothetical protein